EHPACAQGQAVRAAGGNAARAAHPRHQRAWSRTRESQLAGVVRAPGEDRAIGADAKRVTTAGSRVDRAGERQPTLRDTEVAAKRLQAAVSLQEGALYDAGRNRLSVVHVGRVRELDEGQWLVAELEYAAIGLDREAAGGSRLNRCHATQVRAIAKL